MENKKNTIKIIIIILVLVIIAIIVGLNFLRIQNEKNTDKEMNADEYGDYPDYDTNEQENQDNSNNISDETNIDEEESEKIQENHYESLNVTDQQMAQKYFIDYRDNRLYFPEDAYETLEKNYRERRYDSIEEYKKYIDDNRNEIATSVLSKYKVSEENGKKVYICLDQNNQYYFFTESSVMQYTVREGKYNIDPEGFEEEYNNSLDETKAVRDVNRFIAMINNKEYDFAYKILEENFKNENFKTLEEFKEYIKNTFFDDNNVGYDDAKENNGKYICEATIVDNSNESKESIKKTFEITLLEGTDFNISFNK